MKRRDFLRASALVAGGAFTSQAAAGGPIGALAADRRFCLMYAPHFGMFKHSAGDDLTDQLKFAADQGFTAWEDHGLKNRSIDLLRRIAKTMESCGLEMGAFAAVESYEAISFAAKHPSVWEGILRELRHSVEVAKRVRAKWLTVVPGHHDARLPWHVQTANCIELLQRCCDIVEAAGMVMVLEPVSHRLAQAGCFLHSVSQAYQLCRVIDRPSCKILLDCYQHETTTDDLIRLIGSASGEVAYIQCGDRPGRKEPGTGKIDYGRVFQSLLRAGYDGIVGMEHGNSRPGADGERAVIDAYAAVDPC